MVETNHKSTRILIVDDEPDIPEALQASLSAHGFEVRSADDGESALEVFKHWQPELVITDLSMPRMGGIALCESIRATSSVPIIILSVKGDESTKVHALECGADDYVTKPFGFNELLARIKAALRRSSRLLVTSNIIRAGDFLLDLEARRAEISGKEVALTPKEYDLLKFLLENADRVVTPKTLLMNVWGRTYTEQSDAVRVLVRQLRKKIEPTPSSPKYLKTEPWIGYRFKPGE
jgi:two-component system, OmpR family, KDP operon response regulator KdpE